MPLQATSGAASYDAFGGGVPVVPNYIEDVFSTYLYTGNGAVTSVPNGIALGSVYGGAGYFVASNNSRLTFSDGDTENYRTACSGTNYTIEFWVNRISFGGTYQCITSCSTDSNNFTLVGSSNEIWITTNAGTEIFRLSSTTYIPIGTWTHVALVCQGTTWKLYFNGTIYGTYSGSSSDKTYTGGGTGGGQLGGRNDMNGCGYLSNYRLSTVARYTANFTPPTAPFINDASTAMLVCTGATPFTDISSNGITLTVNGSSYEQVGYGPFTDSTAAKGGLVWIKGRSGGTGHRFTDTARGVTKSLASDTTAVEATESTGLTAFNTTGFTIGADADYNTSSATYVSWTFRKQPKFFDVVTYTGNGTAGRTVAHNLGSVPGCFIVKSTSNTSNWGVYHRSMGASASAYLESSSGFFTGVSDWNNTAPTSTEITLNDFNVSGRTYVAYLFAHDAGGFGLTGTDNVISCGSFELDANKTPVSPINLGFEPQWLLAKSTASGAWFMHDIMRGDPTGGPVQNLLANTVGAEVTRTPPDASNLTMWPTPTGLDGRGPANSTFVYIAIRRGPMKVPTSGTNVFGLSARTGTGANATVTGGQTDDAVLVKNRGSAVASLFASRLTGTNYLVTSSDAAEVAAGTTILQANPWDVMDGVKVGTTSTITNASSNTYINYLFKRAPSFFDEVCYTGTGADLTLTHNLTVVPEMIILKSRSRATTVWNVYHKDLQSYEYLVELQSTSAVAYQGPSRFSATPTATTFSIGSSQNVNFSTATYVAYLFATCAGVSKVGSYTGTATTLQIDCGFTAGARFVLIKRTDSTGGWYVWDTARGIVSGNDPYLLLNSTAAEVTNTDYIDTYSAGFELSSTAPAAINASGGTFIFLAIA